MLRLIERLFKFGSGKRSLTFRVARSVAQLARRPYTGCLQLPCGEFLLRYLLLARFDIDVDLHAKPAAAEQQLGSQLTKRLRAAHLSLAACDADGAHPSMRIAAQDIEDCLELVIGDVAPRRLQGQHDAGGAIVDPSGSIGLTGSLTHDVCLFKHLAHAIVGGLPQAHVPLHQ